MVLIDDYKQGLEFLTPFGKEFLSEERNDLYQHIITIAKRRGWKIISYGNYLKWVADQNINDSTWIILDKLFPSTKFNEVSVTLEIHRNLDDLSKNKNGLELIHKSNLKNKSLKDKVVIIDDGIYTGNTIQEVINLLPDTINKIKIIAAAGKKETIERFNKNENVDCSCFFNVDSNIDILHFRDFLPFFPFSGRRILHSNVRLCAPLYLNGRWLHLQQEHQLKKKIKNYQVLFIKALKLKINKIILLNDLKLIGKGIEFQLNHVPDNKLWKNDQPIENIF